MPGKVPVSAYTGSMSFVLKNSNTTVGLDYGDRVHERWAAFNRARRPKFRGVGVAGLNFRPFETGAR